jgi:hypothetical protein
MKKLLGIIVLGLMLSGNANSIEPFENKFIELFESIDKENYMIGAIKYPNFSNKKFNERLEATKSSMFDFAEFMCTKQGKRAAYLKGKINDTDKSSRGGWTVKQRYFCVFVEEPLEVLNLWRKSTPTFTSEMGQEDLENSFIKMSMKTVSVKEQLVNIRRQNLKRANLKFDNKDQQFEFVCVNQLGLDKGSKKFNDCVYKIMSTELELTNINAEKEIALAKAEAAKASQKVADVKKYKAIAKANTQSFDISVGKLIVGLLILSEIAQGTPQADTFRGTLNCTPTGFASGLTYSVSCF